MTKCKKLFSIYILVSLLYGCSRLLMYRFDNPQLTETQLFLDIPKAMGFK